MKVGVRRTTVAATAVVLLPLTGAAECGSGEHAAKDCSLSFTGIHVERGEVVDVVTPTCDVKPQQHTIQVQLQLQVGGEWMQQGRGATRNAPPDQKGYRITVRTPCTEGTWRTDVYVDGIGPNGDGFQYRAQGREQAFSLVDCAG